MKIKAQLSSHRLLLTYYTAVTECGQGSMSPPGKARLSMLEPPADGWRSYIGVGVTSWDSFCSTAARNARDHLEDLERAIARRKMRRARF